MQRGDSNRMLIRSTHISLQPTILTLLLIHLVMMILGDFFLLPLAASNEYIAKGEWWRVITSLLVHVDLQHFLSNSIFCLLLVLLSKSNSDTFLFYSIFSLGISEIFLLILLCRLNIFTQVHQVVFSDY